ncbi:type IV pilin protein, partial [Filifactor villosus]
MKAIQKKRKGFTLAELVVVVTILGILMVIAVTRFS